ncbi:unnamed protein product [Urochloa humidicola]
MSSSTQTSPLQTEKEAAVEEEEAEETNPELYQHFANLVSSLPTSKGLSNNQFYRHDHGWYCSLVPIVEPVSVETAAELFCSGLSPFGPYWKHVLGYWHAHLTRPQQVLFFRYEEMQRDPASHVQRLAEFVGHPFSAEEEEDGVVDAIVRLCSFEHMRGLEVTKSGKTDLVIGTVENSSFFRRGVVGDWANHLSPETARRIDAITAAKFKGSGLSI